MLLRSLRGAVGGQRVVPGSSPVPRWKALEASYLRGEAVPSCAQGQRRRWDKPQSRDPASAEFCAAQNFGRNGYVTERRVAVCCGRIFRAESREAQNNGECSGRSVRIVEMP